MSFYLLPKTERAQLVQVIYNDLLADVKGHNYEQTLQHFSNTDTYIRKTAYIAIGRIYGQHGGQSSNVIELISQLLRHPEYRVRQTAVNSAGEIGKVNFEAVSPFFDIGLFDTHHAVRNAVIGSIKKMSEKNPVPVLQWAQKYLYHPDKEIRREICHGIELRGRTHPQDILPMLKTIQYDATPRVCNTLVHVLGQIAYKKGCLPIVIEHLNTWENKKLTDKAIDEIIDVHGRYSNFAALTQKQAEAYIKTNYKK